MKKVLKFLATITASVMLTGVLVGCAEKTNSENEQNSTATEEKVEEEKVEETELELNLKGEERVTLVQGEEYVEPGVTVNKEEAKVTKKTNLDVNIPGVYEIKYTAKCGKEEKQEIRVVEVVEAEENLQTIYLTFDDGPSMYTAKLLDVLKANNVKATFFVTNADPQYDYILKRIVDEGHTIAVHTYSHDYKEIYSSEESYMEDFNKIRNKIEDVTGVETDIFRFPGGSSNLVSKKYSPGIMTRLTQNMTKAGYVYYDWNVDSKDASGVKYTTEQIKNNVINSLSPERPNIVLQHDIKENSVNAVDSIIKEAKELGYAFSKITKNTPACKHGVNN